MDLANLMPNSENLVLAVSKSKNRHVLAFYWNGNGIDAKWILVYDNSEPVIEPVSYFQSLALGLNLAEDPLGRLKVSFALELADKRELFLVSTEDLQRKYSIIFDDAVKGLCVLEEIYVQFGESLEVNCICKCKQEDGTIFTDIVPANLGPFAQFM